jgi:tetratricopeptide (TPR) repeat protein
VRLPTPSVARVFVTLMFALTLGAAALAQELSAAQQESFDRGLAALKAGRLDEAETAFRAVLDGGGGLAYVHNNLGIVLQRRGQHERAAAEFREAARLDPRYVAPRILLGASLIALGRAAEARAPLEEAVRLDPKQPLARLQLARADERTRDWADAVEQYRVLTKLEPDQPDHVYALGRAYLGLSQWCLAELKGLGSGEARLQQALGHNYRVQGRPDLALRAFERAARADPTLPEVHLALAQIHMEQKQWADARREVDLELAVVPESAGARALLRQIDTLQAASR